MGKKITFCGLVVDIPDPVFVVNGQLFIPATTAVHEAGKRERPRIIKKYSYDSLDVAAMVAANEIYSAISMDSSVEYGIGIYEKGSKYYLTNVRRGGTSSISIDRNLNRFGGWRFVAHVHSHPDPRYTPNNKESEQVFSAADYRSAYENEYVSYFVAAFLGFITNSAFCLCPNGENNKCMGVEMNAIRMPCKNWTQDMARGGMCRTQKHIASEDGTLIKCTNGILMKFMPPSKKSKNGNYFVSLNTNKKREIFRGVTWQDGFKPVKVTPIIKIAPVTTDESIVWKQIVYPYK